MVSAAGLEPAVTSVLSGPGLPLPYAEMKSGGPRRIRTSSVPEGNPIYSRAHSTVLPLTHEKDGGRPSARRLDDVESRDFYAGIRTRFFRMLTPRESNSDYPLNRRT